MHQVIQYQKSGEISVEELPPPQLRNGFILVKNAFSLISAGTERSSVQTAQASIVGKARSRPDLVKQVMDNVKREGIVATYRKVQNRLDNYKELGYSSAGVVLQSTVGEFKVGERIACGGTGFAAHAEIISVPKHLAVKVPDNVSLEEASFATVASIAMHGVRQADVRLGENVAVIGLGLIGLITVQLLKASGCRVFGLDIRTDNFEVAKRLGCDDCSITDYRSIPLVESFTSGHGTDAVIITAATNSNQPVELSLQYARRRSRIVVVGAVKMDFPRSPFYEKELEVRQSCSYGAGRYDPAYEEKGNDYPIGYVRWTENRNMGTVLHLISSGKLDIESLITHTIPVEEALKAYDIVTGKRKEKYLGILLKYREDIPPIPKEECRKEIFPDRSNKQSPIVVGFIGAGNFAQSYLLPTLVKIGVRLRGVVTSRPVNALSVQKKFGFGLISTNAIELIEDPDINTIFVATRHDSHAKYVVDALKRGKHVFVEKPLAVNREQLTEVCKIAGELSDQALMVGFNRRFSKSFGDIKSFFSNRREPFVINYRVNAGFVPKSNWYQDPANGGRIVGEVCHFVDALQYFTDAVPMAVFAACIDSSNSQVTNEDNVNITIRLSDGSVGTISYVANGDNGIGKEYIELFCENSVVRFDNFRHVEFIRSGKRKKARYSGDKGHSSEVRVFVESLTKGSGSPLKLESLIYTTLTTLCTMESLRDGKEVKIELPV